MSSINIEKGIIGLIADSHSKYSLMTRAIDILLDLGAEELIHLGDICDSLMPEKMDTAVEILNKYKIKAVKGNNECSIISEYLVNHPNTHEDSSISFLKKLPYTITLSNICFTHSTPQDWPAATRQPIANYLPIIKGNNPPFNIIFRGHSHKTSVIEIKNDSIKNLVLEPSQRIQLQEDRIYVITVGAVEDGICALYNNENNELCFINFLV
ncbi:MAG: metallophosphoesterase family protein [Spirochaetota bacterium]|nr:metallophosphoesterase family protein [Spirochaetota bacterium]